MKMLFHDRFARRKPLIFLATDTPRLIPEIAEATEKFGVKTVSLPSFSGETDGGMCPLDLGPRVPYVTASLWRVIGLSHSPDNAHL